MIIKSKFEAAAIRPTELNSVAFGEPLEFFLTCNLEKISEKNEYNDEFEEYCVIYPTLIIDGEKDLKIFSSDGHRFEQVLDLTLLAPRGATINICDLLESSEASDHFPLQYSLALALLNHHAAQSQFVIEASEDSQSIDFYLQIGRYDSKTSVPCAQLAPYIFIPS